MEYTNDARPAQVVHLDLYTSAPTYILAFGWVKAGINYFGVAGTALATGYIAANYGLRRARGDRHSRDRLPPVWDAGQSVAGRLSDRTGRKPLIVGGMLVEAVACGETAITT